MPETYRVTHGESLCAPIELRESEGGPQIVGCLIQEGRIASVRAEIFAPGSLVWDGTRGIALRASHLGVEDSRTMPVRSTNGEIRIAAPASAALIAAYNQGRKFLSIEFYAIQQSRNAANVRELQEAYLSGAALVADPEYVQATAEVRSKRVRVWL